MNADNKCRCCTSPDALTNTKVSPEWNIYHIISSDDAIYKEISIVEICGTQTVTLSATDINIDVSVGSSSTKVHNVVNSDFFVNSDTSMCPYNDFVIVDEN